MPKTGKGSRQRKEAAFQRKATQHHEFVGGADAERAEAEFRKHERVEGERSEDAVREMAAELEQAAGLKGAATEETTLRIPRSIEEGKRLLRDAPDAMREKARERLQQLPEGAQKALDIAQTAAGVLFAPVRIGFTIAREVLRVPLAMLRVLRHREA